MRHKVSLFVIATAVAAGFSSHALFAEHDVDALATGLHHYLNGISEPDKLRYIMVPHGRSPEKSYTDEKDPRILFQTHKKGEPMQRFGAYTRRANLYQEIRWNPDTRQVDFLVDDRYDGTGAPKLKPVANKEVCLSCHQNGAPIFPGETSSWNEMTESSEEFGDLRVSQKVKAARNGADHYLGFSIGTSGLKMETHVRLFSAFLQTTQICNTICKDDFACRKDLLTFALTQKTESKYVYFHSLDKDQLLKESARRPIPHALKSALKKNWPVDGFSYTSPTLADIPMDGVSKVGDEKQLDPSTKRAQIGAINVEDAEIYFTDFAASCMGLTREDLKTLSELKPSQIELALQKPAAQELIKAWPPSRRRILDLVFPNSKHKNAYAPDPCRSEKRPDPLPQATIESLKSHSTMLPVETLRPVQSDHFKMLCGECHQGGGLDFDVDFDKPGQLESYVRHNRRRMALALKHRQMPPANASLQPSDTLRDEMRAWVENLR